MSKIAIAAVGGFLATFGLIVIPWLSAGGLSDCSGEECGLEWAAVVTSAIVAGSLVGASCGYAVYALTRRSS